MTTTTRRLIITCPECNFTTSDYALAQSHSCDIQNQGGHCEDFPACGHERGDCNGLLYGSDASIKAQVEKDWREGHGHCDHAEGLYNCAGEDDYDDTDECAGCEDEENAPHTCGIPNTFHLRRH